MTSPDISSGVRTMDKFCENPGLTHWKVVVKILKYVQRTPARGITYGGDGNGRTVMRAFVDLDHAVYLDTPQVGRYVWAVALSAGFQGPRRSCGGNFGGTVRGHVGDRKGGNISPSGTGLYHACPRE